MTLKDLAALADCFYIGGTKNGLLFGEAMVIVNPALQKDFRYMIKHNGGMIAKGRLGGVMFLAALEHDDYFAWAKHANEMAISSARAWSAQAFPSSSGRRPTRFSPC